MRNILKSVLITGIVALCISCNNAEYNAFMQAKQSHSIEQLEQYISDYPEGEYLDEARREISNIKDDNAFDIAKESESIETLEQYLQEYPDGRHSYEAHREIENIKNTIDDNAYNEALQEGTIAALKNYMQRFSTDGRHYVDAEREIERIELERWSHNSLSTGSTPYSAHYGSGNSCYDWDCSQIKVTGPHGADVIVIIKKGNSEGRVVRHAYIRSGGTYTFNLPNGRYQTFFYYGNGWNPNKEMPGGVKGGFVKDEQYSKDNPEYIENQVLTYVLQLTINGNFSTRPSSENEIF